MPTESTTRASSRRLPVNPHSLEMVMEQIESAEASWGYGNWDGKKKHERAGITRSRQIPRRRKAAKAAKVARRKHR